jgi:hypothetical protein
LVFDGLQIPFSGVVISDATLKFFFIFHFFLFSEELQLFLSLLKPVFYGYGILPW